MVSVGIAVGSLLPVCLVIPFGVGSVPSEISLSRGTSPAQVRERVHGSSEIVSRFGRAHYDAILTPHQVY